ncbi:VCBS repeat-containing protein [Robertmurraya kyonggiensis]|uniref:VCBS repeat-containing protein n=1 Tax=Robertmurraya kyonggiensis TaxID=1037680 RepID=UPI001FE3DC37|nr:VCBS repeat-containing protein [Robertmurraya kyonggiensis]
MDNRAKWKLLMYISIGIMLSGCSMAKSPGELIESPQLHDGQNLKVKETLKQLLPSGIEYMTPEQAAIKRSIIIEDIHGDGKQEAFILYRNMKENQQVHLLVLQQKNQKWTKISDIETDYNNIHYFGLHDLDDDGVMEVTMGLGTSDFENEKQLIIYQWDKAGLKKLMKRSYHLLDIADYDGDKKIDVLLVDGKRRTSFTAELFRYENGALKSRSAVDLEAYSFHENMVSGTLNDGNKALFIDSTIGVHSMLTEIIAYDHGELVKVGEKNGGPQIKKYPLYSKDINEDGVTEVGEMYIPQGWEDALYEDIPFIEFYSTYSIDGTSKKITERFIDRVRRFYIEIPSEWHGRVTVKKVKNGIQLLSVSNQKPVFEVKWVKKGSSESSKAVLKETKDTIFYSDRKENETFPFNQFHLLENEF